MYAHTTSPHGTWHQVSATVSAGPGTVSAVVGAPEEPDESDDEGCSKQTLLSLLGEMFVKIKDLQTALHSLEGVTPQQLLAAHNHGIQQIEAEVCVFGAGAARGPRFPVTGCSAAVPVLVRNLSPRGRRLGELAPPCRSGWTGRSGPRGAPRQVFRTAGFLRAP
jgi:hypothetical protein